ncbi:MAG: hypothetical protein KKE44_25160 [Proteobacteria bacterium]|nr:hypothetical protein [Pseudomonadota bacterium]MBU1586021.1 hypothetical protein [Pseudomonadota bacterium]MBU2453419.1 hypothetical protein [Pseudomonadota bacterium]MBU2627460.1 hypothetical protein [Pseudomonadota bacterium]
MDTIMNEKTDALTPEPPKDDFAIRCPRLGHQISFTYCRSENSGLPCFKTLDCWYSYFDVHTHLKEKLSEEDFKKVFLKQAKPKVFSLIDLIEQAKKNQGE